MDEARSPWTRGLMRGCALLAAALGACALAGLAGCKDAIAGGQTGDPGVTDDTEVTPGGQDYVSIVPSGMGTVPGPGGPCGSVARTYAVPADSDAGALSPLDAARALYLDRGSGRIVDLSDLDAPRLRARLDFGAVRAAFAAGGGRALIVAYRPDAGFAADAEGAARLGDDRVLLVDLANPDAPAVLAAQAVAGDVALANVVERSDGVRVYVVADEITRECVAPTKRTTLHAFAVANAGLEPAGMLDLGAHVAAVAVRAGRLLVIDDPGDPATGTTSAGSASVIALDAPDGTLARSAAAAGTGALGLQPRVWVERAGTRWTVLVRGLQQAQLFRYDDADPGVLSRTGECALPAETGELGGLWVLGERALVTSWPNQDGSTLFELDGAGCSWNERRDVWLQRVPEGDALVELDFAAGSALEARLIAPESAAPIASARAALEPASGARFAPWASSVLAFGAGTMGDVVEPHWLAVPIEAGGARGGLQLFSISASSLHAQARLATGWTLAAATAQGVATTTTPGDHGQLATFALDGPQPSPLATLVLQPSFVRGYALDGARWARLHKPAGVRVKGDEGITEQELLAPDASALAALEVIAHGGDPELAPVLARVELNPYAQLVRLGSLFAAVTNHEHGTPGTTRIELFDFSDPPAPRARGTLESDALWVQNNDGMLRGPAIECLDCDRPGGDGPIGLATKHALVLRGYRWIAGDPGHSAFAFEVVDLSDADHPKLGPTLTMPDEDHAIGAVALGDDVYYRYLRPVAGEPGRARYYLRRIALGDPSAPELGKPVQVPGDPVAIIDAHTLYSVELSGEDPAFRFTLHRLRVRDGVARIEHSRELGERRPQAVSVDGDRVLVDLGPPLSPIPLPIDGVETTPDPPLRLLVLDAATLEPIVEGDVAFGASRLGAGGGRVGYSTWSGAVLVNASAPDDPARQQVVPGDGVPLGDVQLQFAGDRALLVDADRGTLRELLFGSDGAQP